MAQGTQPLPSELIHRIVAAPCRINLTSPLGNF